MTFQRFAYDPRVARWAEAARRESLYLRGDDVPRRHGGTWVVGVDALPNAPDGSVAGVPLAGPWDVTCDHWHRAQVSVVFQGYPGRDPGESEAAHRFRRDRFAAHLDGLLPEGPEKRRHLREPHEFILGIALNDVPEGAAPLVVWQSSDAIMRKVFVERFEGISPDLWGDEDVTEAYQAARSRVFERCEPVPVPLRVGEAVLVNRHAIHGVSPWTAGVAEPRMVAYFRPLLSRVEDWLA